MIEESTYISNKSNGDNCRITKMKVVLSAFSAADESLLNAFDEPTINYLFIRLLSRLSTLCYLHGSHVPQSLFNDLVASNSSETFDLINSYLENGNSVSSKNRELQQELLHFSRIVDIKLSKEEYSLAEDYLSNKRIKNSKYLPDSLKVLSELITVVRSRLIQRGLKPKTPIMRSSHLNVIELDNKVFLITNSDKTTDFIVTIKSSRRRFTKELIYSFRHLLTYLTPEEALLSIITYTNEVSQIKNDMSFMGLFLKEKCITKINYTKEINDKEFFKGFYNPIPNISEFLVLENEYVEIIFDQNNVFKFTCDNSQISCTFNDTKSFTLENFKKNISTDVIKYFLDKSVELIKDQRIIETIECGHIHLDRKIDFDQECGFKIGRHLYEYLSSVQEKKPLLFPMIDDDHVLISLKPKEYENIMEKFIGREYELVPESSPIVRAIVVSLYKKLMSSNKRDKVKRLGNNIYISMNENITCELFEDYDGRCDNGCVFFELGLLIYRSNASKFVEFFKKRFDLNYNPHEYMINILNEDTGHDEKFHSLCRWKEQFYDITNPKNPDKEFYILVESVIANGRVYHLNILEDYYENQQKKVRSLIELMDLPINLLSLHFNTITSRISLN